MTEPQQPKAAPTNKPNIPNNGAIPSQNYDSGAVTNNQNSLDEAKRDIVAELSNAYYETYRYDRPNDTVEQLQAFCRDLAENDVDELLAAQSAAINKTIMEARINQCERLDPYIDPEFRELYEQELDGLTKKYGRADNEPNNQSR